jgi:sulfite reductase alpha subunit-like flavoprotein
MKVLREADNGRLIAQHILERNGAVYIAGGPKMARAVKEEIVEALGKEFGGNEKQANQLLNKLQRVGKFSIEAWS